MMGTKLARFDLTALENHVEVFIKEIKTLEDDQLLERYKQTIKIGEVAWRMECACAAEMLRRAVDRRKDRDEESGKVAAARSLAAKLDVTTQTIYESAKIHRVFFADDEFRDVPKFAEIAKNLNKSFFELASGTPDPQGTIQRFADAKAANPDFSVRDAKRLIAHGEAPPLDDIIWSGMDEQKRAIWSEYQRATSGMKYHFPAVRLLLAEHLDDLKESLKALSSTTVREAILKLIREDRLSNIEEITKALGKPRDYVLIWLGRMVEAGDLIHKKKPRDPGARGAEISLWEIPENKSRH